MNLFDYLKSSQSSIYRLESLQYYYEEDSSDFESFLKTGEVDLKTNSEWFQFINKKNLEGVKTQRIRIVEYPLTDYTKYELEFHKEAIQYGDEIKIVDKEELDDLELEDFWIVDEKLVLKMNYGNDGKFIGFEKEENEEKVLNYLNKYKLLLEKSTVLSV